MTVNEICEFCKKPCFAKWIDCSIGETEFWGVLSIHEDGMYVSSCCHAPLMGPPPEYEEDDFDIPEEYWEY